MSEELRSYVYQSLVDGVSRDTIRAELARGKWPNAEIEAALNSFLEPADEPGIPLLPVPRRRPKLSARDAMQYVLMFVSLWVSAYALDNIAYNALDAWVPDPGRLGETWNKYTIASSLAALLVTAPIFGWFTRRIAKDVAADGSLRESPVRKWVTYGSMTVASCVTIGTLINSLTHFFQGEYPLNAVLKLAVTVVICGGILLYYRAQQQEDETVA